MPWELGSGEQVGHRLPEQKQCPAVVQPRVRRHCPVGLISYPRTSLPVMTHDGVVRLFWRLLYSFSLRPHFLICQRVLSTVSTQASWSPSPLTIQHAIRTCWCQCCWLLDGVTYQSCTTFWNQLQGLWTRSMEQEPKQAKLKTFEDRAQDVKSRFTPIHHT